MKPSVYLAGPDVFDPDSQRIFATRGDYCATLGIKAIIPLDNTLTSAEEIYKSNVRLLESATAVIANISPFRGPHCDVGTAFEIGYARSRGIPVWAFSKTGLSLAARVGGSENARADAEGVAVEPFGLAENLMIVEALYDRVVHQSFEEAADGAARVLFS
jgi:nucleoside 2-deoxyribosyltransferase